MLSSNPTEMFGVIIPDGLVIPALLALPVFFIAMTNLNQPKNPVTSYEAGLRKSKSELDALFPTAKPTSFGGPFGAAMMPVFLPFLCFFLYFSCNKDNIVHILPGSENFLKYTVNPFANGFVEFAKSVFDLKVFGVYVAWVMFHFLMYLIVPGEVVEGTPLRAPFNKVRLKYRINALTCHVLSFLVLGALVFYGILPPTYGYDNFIQLFVSSWIFSFSLSIGLYIHSRRTIPNKQAQTVDPLNLLSLHGNSDNLFYDFWMGRTLNPRCGFLDLKYVIELRPGLILWSVLNISNAFAQYRELGYVSYSMILVCLFQAYYVLDSHLSEKAILTTIDIVSDGFGFMLAFGSLTWVPFTYTTQTRFLVNYDPQLSWYCLVGIVALKLTGLWIFRSANNEKNNFRTNPNAPECKHLEFILTKTGRKLICSSWWGKSRHINYWGDWLMALAWSLPCGFTLLPYFYPIYFASLLIDRQGRDDEKCHHQYGEDWERYCERVPYKIIPYIY